MTLLLSLPLAIISLIVLTLAVFFALEVGASFLHRPPEPPPPRPRGRIAVLIPAHNEEAGVAETVRAARLGLESDDLVLVIADNCTDGTATAARAAGADIAERADAAKRGKGYALQFGVDQLRADPPETVVFLDADCAPAAGAIERIARLAVDCDRPVQALYLVRPAPDGGPASAVSAFAWLLINRVRMAGLQALGGFTRLTGSGMAFPWTILEDRALASGEIVEDLALTISLLEDGVRPLLDTGALVESELARSAAGAATQRARWELGSLRLAARRVGGLIGDGLSGDWRLLLMALDLMIAPLTVFAAVIVFGAVLAIPFALGGHAGPLAAFFEAALVFGLAVAAAWFAYGRTVLPPDTLAGLGDYLAGKLRVYGAEGRKSAKGWTRTDRGEDQ